MSAKRVKRPKLERDRPRREWSTLFGTAGQPKEGASGPAPAPRPTRPGSGATLSDTVELGYRVIDDYLKQGRQVAQGFGAQSWLGGAGGPSPVGSPEEMQQMAQKVMQYGWDFAGLWFEMWTRMGGPTGMPPVPGAHPHAHAAPTPPSAEKGANGKASPAPESDESDELTVSVESARPASASVQVRPGKHGELVIHALRLAGDDGPPIKGVTLERSDDGHWDVNVVVPATQKAGTYRAAIVAAASNAAVGTLTVRVQAKKR